ncbi:MAG: aminotransferase class III-fold pyridoxal phosphate-dependent enzyme [Paracoccaceae bacterium]
MARSQASTLDVSDRGLPRVSHGRGSYIWDTDGKRYIDGSGGPAVYCVGHGDPRVNAAVAAQMERIAHGYRYFFTSDPLEEMTGIVAGGCGGSLSEMVFVTGGSEANESAMKIALQYHYDRGEPGRTRFIARERSWHGNTLMATALSGFRGRTRAFARALPEMGRVSAANAYRPPEGVPSGGLVPWLAAELEAEIARLGPATVAAFVFEPVVGAAGGCVPAPAGYAAAMAGVCRRHGVLVISDEVMCGSGRSGVWRASVADGFEPDIVTVAKGLSGGYLPLGAAVFTTAVGDVLRAGHGGPLTGHTYTGHTACLAAGVAVQRIIAEEGLVGRVAARGPVWMEELRGRFARFDEVGDVRGRGYFIGTELVRDPATRAPFPAAAGLNERVRAEAFARGLICYPAGGNVNGTDGDFVILAPPYNASDAELEEIAEKLESAVEAALVAVL